MPLIGKSAHGIKQFECSVDLLSPPHLFGNMYIVLCPKLYYQFQYIQGPPDDKRVHNSHVLVDDHGSIAAVYRKIHLFDIDVKDGPQLKESDGTIPGDQIVPPVPTPVGNVGLAIVSLMGHGGIKLTLTKRKMGFVPYNLTTSIGLITTVVIILMILLQKLYSFHLVMHNGPCVIKKGMSQLKKSLVQL